jgi:hypothetical protein
MSGLIFFAAAMSPAPVASPFFSLAVPRPKSAVARFPSSSTAAS